MFEQLKQILTIDYQNELARFDHLKKGIEKIEHVMMNDKSEDEYQNKLLELNQKYNLLTRSSQEYKNELASIQIEYSEKLKKFEELYNYCIDLKNEAANINIYVIQKKKEQLMNATSLEDLKMTEEDASQIIEEKQDIAPIIYTEDEIDEYLANYVENIEYLSVENQNTNDETVENITEENQENLFDENISIEEENNIEEENQVGLQNNIIEENQIDLENNDEVIEDSITLNDSGEQLFSDDVTEMLEQNSSEEIDSARAEDVNDLEDNSDEELIKLYIGKKYDKLSKKKFSLASFFFGGIYLIYRKMYVLGIIIYAATLLLNMLPLFLNNISMYAITTCVSLLVNIVLAVMFPKLYLKYASKQVQKIKETNMSKSNEEIFSIVSKKGGTSFITLVIIMIIFGTISGYATTFISFDDSYFDNNYTGSNEDNELDYENNFNSDTSNDEKYNGILQNDTNVIIDNVFDMKIPNKFEEGFMNDEDRKSYEYETANSGSFNSCEFEITSPIYSSASNLINDMSDYNNVSDTVSSTVINDLVWYTFIENDAFGKNYYYATDIDGKPYLVQYQIGSDVVDDDSINCVAYKNQLMNSIIKK